MQSIRNCCCLLLAMVSTQIILTGLVSAQDAPPEWKKIRAALEKRRERFGQFSCRLETTRLVPITMYEGLEGKPLVKKEGRQDIHVDLRTGRIRFDDETPRFNVQTKKFVTLLEVNVCDGKEIFTFHPNYATWQENEPKPFHLIKGHLEGAGPLRSFTGRPLLKTFGILRPSDFVSSKITDLPSLGFRFQQMGDEIIATAQTSAKTITKYVFDESKDFCVTRILLTTINGEKRQETTFTYAERDGEWQLVSWLTLHPKSVVSFSAQVKQFQTHSQLDPKLFKVPEEFLKPGMTYADSSTPGTPGFHFVGPDGELKPLFDRQGRRLDQKQNE